MMINNYRLPQKNKKTKKKKELCTIYLLEVVTDLELALLVGDVWLDFSVSIIDDGQEHVQQDEEHEEHVGDEENRSKYAIGCLEGVEVKVTKDNTEQRKTKIKMQKKPCVDSKPSQNTNS